MTGYDPQRNRTRSQPSADGPAPVDLLLGGDPPQPPAPAEPDVPDRPAPDGHEHGPDCGHDPERDPRVLMAATAVSAGVVLYLFRRQLRRRRLVR